MEPADYTIRFIIFGIIVYIIGIASFTAAVAQAKGYSTGAWFAAGLFFPIIALIAIVGMPEKKKDSNK